MGFSPDHSSSVPLVYNPVTGSITPQFHIVADNWFATVATKPEDLPDFDSDEWNKLFGDSSYQYVVHDDSEDIVEPMPLPATVTQRALRVTRA